MDIVVGRGKSRQKITLPSAAAARENPRFPEVLKKAAKDLSSYLGLKYPKKLKQKQKKVAA